MAPSLRIVRLGFAGGFFDAFVETLSASYAHSGKSALRSVGALRVDAIKLLRTDSDPVNNMYHELDGLRVLMIKLALSSTHYRLLPSIVRFARSSVSLASQFHRTPEICLPRLSTLVLSDSVDPDIDALKELITARRAVAPIKRLLISWDKHSLSELDVDWLAHNVETVARFSQSGSCVPYTIDTLLEQVLEADLPAETEGVSFLEVFSRLY